MKRLLVSLMTVASFTILVAPSAEAQLTTDIGIAVGGTSPQNHRLGGRDDAFGEPSGVDVVGGARTGFTIVGSVGIAAGSSVLGYRVEAQYSRFELEEEGRWGGGGAPLVAEGHASMFNGTGNVVLRLPVPGRVHPYLIGGAGIYRLSSEVRDAADGRALDGQTPWRSETAFGLNGGAGFAVGLGSMRTFVEARFHSIRTGVEKANLVPITFGLKF